jgi:hypothetical protein
MKRTRPIDSLRFATAAASALRSAIVSEDPGFRAHVDATERLLQDPNAGFQRGINQVKTDLGAK